MKLLLPKKIPIFQAVTFLILLNLSMWVAYTFGLQKHLYTILEELRATAALIVDIGVDI